MIPIIYSYNETEFASRGYGALADCISCTVTEELNGAYTLELKYAKNGINNEYLQPRNIILCKPNNNIDRQLFRIYKVNRSLKNQIAVYANQISYDLTGYTVFPHRAENLIDIASVDNIVDAIALLNEAIQTAEGDFEITTNKTSNGTFRVDVPSSVRSWFGGKEGSLLDVYGGEWEFEMFDCRLLTNRGQDKGTRISENVNLAQYVKELQDSLYSAVVPYFAKYDGDNLIEQTGYTISTNVTAIHRILNLDVTSDLSSEYGKYIDLGLADRTTYPLEYQQVIDFTQFPDIAENIYYRGILGTTCKRLSERGIYDSYVSAYDSLITIMVATANYGLGFPVKLTEGLSYFLTSDISAVDDDISGMHICVAFADENGNFISRTELGNFGGRFTAPARTVWGVIVFYVTNVRVPAKRWQNLKLVTIPTVDELNQLGQAYIDSHNLDADMQTISVEPDVLTTEVSLGDTVHVIYEGSMVDTRAVKYTWDVLAERYLKFELGKIKENIAETIKALGMSSTPVAVGGSSGGGSSIVVDAGLSNTSINPVQNKVITNALNQKQDTITDADLSDMLARIGVFPSKILFDTKAHWNAQTTLISEQNVVYVYTDYQSVDGQNVAGIKIGDGLAYVVDLPFLDTIYARHVADETRHITQAEREFWNNKNRAYMSLTDSETMILTIN